MSGRVRVGGTLKERANGKRTSGRGGRRHAREEAAARDHAHVRERAERRERLAEQRSLELGPGRLLCSSRDEEKVHLPCVDAPARKLLARARHHVCHVRATLQLQLGEGLANGSVADALDEGVLRAQGGGGSARR